jgi:Na+:H+ antiporter
LPRRDDILIATFAVVAFSVIVQGLTAPVALRALGIVPGGKRQSAKGGSQ